MQSLRDPDRGGQQAFPTALEPFTCTRQELGEFAAAALGLGVRYLGVLLMGSLIIIPAATARHLAHNLAGMLFISVAVAIASTAIGTYGAGLLHRETGPFIISVAGGIFFLGLLV